MGVKGIDWNSTALPLSKSLLIRDFFSKVLGLVRFSLHRLPPGVSFLFCSHSQVSSHSQDMGSSAHFWAQPSYLGQKSPELHSSPGDEAACHPICHPTVFLLILVEDHSNLSLKPEPLLLFCSILRWNEAHQSTDACYQQTSWSISRGLWASRAWPGWSGHLICSGQVAEQRLHPAQPNLATGASRRQGRGAASFKPKQPDPVGTICNKVLY